MVSLVRDLDFSQVDLLAQMASTYPGLYLQGVTRRLYPGEVQPLVVGSVRLPTAEDLAAVQVERDRYRELGRMFYRSAAEEAEFRRLQHRQLSQALRPDESTGREYGMSDVALRVAASLGMHQQLHPGADFHVQTDVADVATDVRVRLELIM